MGIIMINLLCGCMLGYALHRARFCFAGAFRDFLLFKDGGLLKALIVSLMLSTILFAGVQSFRLSTSGILPGNFYPIGLYTIVGGILFGIGMVVAGGCVCSIFLRLGEGFKVFVFVFIGLVAGSMVGAAQYSWWAEKFTWLKPVFLGDIGNWGVAILVQITILALLYRYVLHIEKNNL